MGWFDKNDVKIPEEIKLTASRELFGTLNDLASALRANARRDVRKAADPLSSCPKCGAPIFGQYPATKLTTGSGTSVICSGQPYDWINGHKWDGTCGPPKIRYTCDCLAKIDVPKTTPAVAPPFDSGAMLSGSVQISRCDHPYSGQLGKCSICGSLAWSCSHYPPVNS